jgi:hypothetical protein
VKIGCANEVGRAQLKTHSFVAGDVDDEAARGEGVEVVPRDEYQRMVAPNPMTVALGDEPVAGEQSGDMRANCSSGTPKRSPWPHSW